LYYYYLRTNVKLVSYSSIPLDLAITDKAKYLEHIHTGGTANIIKPWQIITKKY